MHRWLARRNLQQKGFIRFGSLPDYSEDAIREIISGKRTVTDKPSVEPKQKTVAPAEPRKINLLIDIQNSIKAQNSPGYAQWSKIFNLKAAASTLIFLQENGLDDIEKLHSAAQKAKDDFNGINIRIQGIDARLKDISALQKHIGVYSKTREVYAAYRKAGYSKTFLAEHEDSIAAHKAAKKYFDVLGLEKLPSISTLKTEYTALSAEKKKLYADYHPARKYMQDILAAEQNAKSLLNYRETTAYVGVIRHPEAGELDSSGGGIRHPAAGELDIDLVSNGVIHFSCFYSWGG